jgi:hypothetical protein
LSLLNASVVTRFWIFDGGVASARDPKYTVGPANAANPFLYIIQTWRAPGRA